MCRQALTLLLPCLLAAVIGCQTSPRATPLPPLPPTSIAVTPGQIAPAGSWTTPAIQPPSLVRTPTGVPDGLVTSSLNPTFGSPGVGDAVERRLDQGLATAAPWRAIASASSTYLFASDLETGGQGPSQWLNEARVSLEKPLDYFGTFGVFFSYAHRRYDWRGSNALIAGTDRPFSGVHALRAGVNLFQPVSDSWAVVVSFSASVAAADGADLTEGFGWSATAGGGHRFSDKLEAGLGILVSNTFGDGLSVFGGPQFTWRPSRQWQIALQGAELDIAYRPAPAWELGLSGAFEGVRFRLPEDAPGDRPGGIVAESRLPVFFWVRYRGAKQLDLELRAGLDVWRYFTVEDRGGGAEYSVEMDPAPFIGVRAIFRL